MIPQCVITGVIIQYPEGTRFNADLFDYGSVWIVNANMGSGYVEHFPSPEERVIHVHNYDFFERRGVHVIQKSEATLSQAAIAYIEEYNL